MTVKPSIACVAAQHKSPVTWTPAKAMSASLIFDRLQQSRLKWHTQWNIFTDACQLVKQVQIVRFQLSWRWSDCFRDSKLPVGSTLYHGSQHSDRLLIRELHV